MPRNVVVFTGTRAEYGLLRRLIALLASDPAFDVRILASGMHLSPQFGGTLGEIERDGLAPVRSVEMLLSSDTAIGVAKSVGLGVIGYADALAELSPDLLIVLGDRFEALAVAQTALIMQVPIVHIHGGELTEGAYDDAIRHSITKMASLHFTSTESHRRRVIQLGERPESVFNVGALGIDAYVEAGEEDFQALNAFLEGRLRRPYALVTYHPETASGGIEPAEGVRTLFAALDAFPGHQVLVTYPNADNGGHAIIAQIERAAAAQPDRIIATKSLGMTRYVAAVANADLLVGNSSSGLIEAPACRVPTVNVGNRQKGRLRGETVIDCDSHRDAIVAAIGRALSEPFRRVCAQSSNPYGNGGASRRIHEIIGNGLPHGGPKKFHDLETADVH